MAGVHLFYLPADGDGRRHVRSAAARGAPARSVHPGGARTGVRGECAGHQRHGAGQEPAPPGHAQRRSTNSWTSWSWRGPPDGSSSRPPSGAPTRCPGNCRPTSRPCAVAHRSWPASSDRPRRPPGRPDTSSSRRSAAAWPAWERPPWRCTGRTGWPTASRTVHQDGDDHLAARARLLDYLRQNAHAANRFLSRFLDLPISAPAPGVVQVVIDSREDALDWYAQEDPAFLAVQRSAADPALLRHRLNLTLEWAAYNEVEGRWGEEIGASGGALEAALEIDDPVTINRAGHNLVRALIETGRLQDTRLRVARAADMLAKADTLL